MIGKIAILVALAAIASASIVSPVLPGPTVAPVVKTVEYDAHPQYSYSYGVNDPLTGDVKSQVETRNGDAVEGQYSLIDSDGTQRIVDYAANDLTGFNAVVRKLPLAPAVLPAPAPVVSAKVVAPIAPAFAPSISAYNAPFSYPYSGHLGYGYGSIARYPYSEHLDYGYPYKSIASYY